MFVGSPTYSLAQFSQILEQENNQIPSPLTIPSRPPISSPPSRGDSEQTPAVALPSSEAALQSRQQPSPKPKKRRQVVIEPPYMFTGQEKKKCHRWDLFDDNELLLKIEQSKSGTKINWKEVTNSYNGQFTEAALKRRHYEIKKLKTNISETDASQMDISFQHSPDPSAIFVRLPLINKNPGMKHQWSKAENIELIEKVKIATFNQRVNWEKVAISYNHKYTKSSLEARYRRLMQKIQSNPSEFTIPQNGSDPHQDPFPTDKSNAQTAEASSIPAAYPLEQYPACRYPLNTWDYTRPFYHSFQDQPHSDPLSNPSFQPQPLIPFRPENIQQLPEPAQQPQPIPAAYWYPPYQHPLHLPPLSNDSSMQQPNNERPLIAPCDEHQGIHPSFNQTQKEVLTPSLSLIKASEDGAAAFAVPSTPVPAIPWTKDWDEILLIAVENHFKKSSSRIPWSTLSKTVFLNKFSPMALFKRYHVLMKNKELSKEMPHTEKQTPHSTPS